MELVQVKCYRFKTGQSVPSSFINGAELAVLLTDEPKVYPWHFGGHENYTDVEDVIRAAVTSKPDLREFSGSETDYTFAHDLLLMDFTFVGEGRDEHYSGGGEWDIENGEGTGNWFSEEHEDLVKTALKMLSEPSGLDVYNWYGFCRWIVGLSFSGGVDSYTGEYDCTTEYLGYIDLDTIKTV